MPQYYTLPTAIGEAKIANAIALGMTITISELAIGDGGGTTPVPDSNVTALVNQVRRAPINTSVVDPDNPSWIVVEQVLPPDIGGWTIREIGLYDADGDLIAYGNYPETYKPVLSEGSGRTQTIRFVMQVSDTAAVTLKVDPSVVLATRAYVDDGMAAHEQSRNHPDGTTTGKGFLRKATSTEAKARSSTVPVVTPAGLGAALTEHEQAETAHNDNQIGISVEILQAKGAENVSATLAALGSFAADGYQNVAVFDTPGVTSWPVPDVLKNGLRKAHVSVTGGGGSGASGSSIYCAGGGGGGTSLGLLDLTGVAAVDITVGAGGPERQPTGAGYDGNSSSFGAYLTAYGGLAGLVRTGANNGAAAGVGGYANFRGGDGTNATVSGDGGVGVYGGTGGSSFWCGGTTGASNAGDNAKHGAGGGGNTNTASNAGGYGFVVVRW